MNAGTCLKTRARVTGSHHPDGVFMAAGNGIRKGLSIAPLSIVDVCPTLLYSTGIDIPKDLDGILAEDISTVPL